MKQWLRKIFFWNESPQGAHFGLTLFFVMPYIWLSLLCWICILIQKYDSRIFDVHKQSIWQLFTGSSVIIAIIVIAYGIFLLLHALVVNRHGLLKKLPWGMLVQGVIFCTVSVGLLAFFIFKIIICCFYINANILVQLTYTPLNNRFLNAVSSGNKTFIGIMLIIVLFAVGYVSLGKTIAGIGQIPYKRLWTNGVKDLWIFCLIFYLISWSIGLLAVCISRMAVANFEKTVGKPVTSEAITEVYFHGQQPDADFWKSLFKNEPASFFRRERYKALGESADGCYAETILDVFNYTYPFTEGIPQDVIDVWRKEILDTEQMKSWEALFDKSLPPNARDYSNSLLLVGAALSEGSNLHVLCGYEKWRIRLALEAKDFSAVETALARMRRTSEFMENDTFLNGGMVWIMCESDQLDALTRIIESRLPSDEWLRQLDQRMESREQVAMQVMQNTIYGEAVYSLNLLKMFWHGKMKTGEINSIHLGMVNLLLPQLLYIFANEHKCVTEMFHHFLDPDFPYENSWHLFFHDIWPSLVHAQISTKDITAEYRILRGLVAAELHRRQHGSFPLEMNPFEDPHAIGNPLKYQCGEMDVIQYVWNTEKKKAEPQQRKIYGVKIWTVGFNRQDNGGLRTDEGRQDDMNYWLRDTQ